MTALTASVAGIAALCACASESDVTQRSRIAPSGPIAEAIVEAKAHPGPAPTFADIPKAPKDIRPAASWTSDSAALQTATRDLAVATAQPPEIADPDALAKQLRAQSGLDAINAPAISATAELDAYARELRERATPPPPPK